MLREKWVVRTPGPGVSGVDNIAEEQTHPRGELVLVLRAAQQNIILRLVVVHCCVAFIVGVFYQPKVSQHSHRLWFSQMVDLDGPANVAVRRVRNWR